MKRVKMVSFLPLFLLAFTLVSALPPTPFAVSEEPKGTITFQPNVVPSLVITDRPLDKPESFRFEWLGNRFDIELFFNATLMRKVKGSPVYENVTRLWSLRDFEVDFNVTVNYNVNKTESRVQFGWVIDDVEDVSDFVYGAWFKIEDTQPFDYEDIKLETIEVFDNETSGEPLAEPYNLTSFCLPDNLVLSFEDLRHKGFVIGHQNKTSTSIKGFSGKSSWNLDPITYSAPTITVIGGTEGSELDSMDIWNADQANGWNVFLNHNNTNVQFELSCKIVFGNGTVAGTIWFADREVQWVCNDGVMTAHYQKWMELKRYSHVRFGVLEDLTNKVTSRGCSFISLENSYVTYLVYEYSYDTTAYFYSSSFDAKKNCVFAGNNLRIWNSIATNKMSVSDTTTSNVFDSIFTEAVKADNCIYYPRGTWEKISITNYLNALYLRYAGTIVNLYVRNCTRLWYGSAFTGDVNLVNCDSDIWTGAFGGADTAELYRQYTYDLTVQYPNGTTVNGTETAARVEILHYGQSYTVDYNATLGGDGTIPQQTLSKGFYNQTGGDTIYIYEPYNLQISNVTGYNDYSGNFTLSAATDWTITLSAETVNEPVARYTFSPSNPEVNEQISFDASESWCDPKTSISTYSWSWGGSGATATTTYATAGTYTVALTVTDAEANSDTFTQTISVSIPASPASSGAAGAYPTQPSQLEPADAISHVTYQISECPSAVTFQPWNPTFPVTLSINNNASTPTSAILNLLLCNQSGYTIWTSNNTVSLQPYEQKQVTITIPKPNTDANMYLWIQQVKPETTPPVYIGFYNQSFQSWLTMPFIIGAVACVAMIGSGYGVQKKRKSNKKGKPRYEWQDNELWK